LQTRPAGSSSWAANRKPISATPVSRRSSKPSASGLSGAPWTQRSSRRGSR
jgi:hypothetical protein